MFKGFGLVSIIYNKNDLKQDMNMLYIQSNINKIFSF